MSGHSKWSKVKHQKASTDAIKGAAFTKASHAITIAVRGCGGVTDPAMNFHLRLAIEKARAVNMPKENIARAIERAKADRGNRTETIVYEAYGPGGIGLLIETVTENRVRTVSAIKNTLDRYGGSIASPGAVQYLFARSGVLGIAKKVPFDTMFEAAVMAGADDVVERDDVYEVYTGDTMLFDVKEKLEARLLLIQFAQLVMKPKNVVSINKVMQDKIGELLEKLEALDDVQEVYSNEKRGE